MVQNNNKYCHECGEKLTQRSKFCKSCGKKVGSNNQEARSGFNFVSSLKSVPKNVIALIVGILVIGVVFVSKDSSFPSQISSFFQNCDLSVSSEKALSSVVKINTEFGAGSGFFIDKEYIVTNNHVIEGVKEADITLSSGKELKSTIYAWDAEADLAILKLTDPLEEATTLKLSSSKQPIASEVVAIGYPLSDEEPLQGDATVTKGTISAYRDGLHGIRYIQTDTSINPGNSGGPMINECGEVIGVSDLVYKSLSAADPIFYAISGSSASKSIDSMISEPQETIADGTLPRFEDEITASDVVTAYYENLYEGYYFDAYQLFSVKRQKDWNAESWLALFEDVASIEVDDIKQISSDPLQVQADIRVYTTDGFNYLEEPGIAVWTLGYSQGRLALESLDVDYEEPVALFDDDFADAVSYNKSLSDTLYPSILSKDLSYYPQDKVVRIKSLIDTNTKIINKIYSRINEAEPFTEDEVNSIEVWMENHDEILEINSLFESIDWEIYYSRQFGN